MSERFTLVKKGYDITEVEAYITKLEEILASYKEKDNAIKNALISAQIAADNIIKNADIEAQNSKAGATKYLKELNSTLSQQKESVKRFEEDYRQLVEKYLHPINANETSKTFEKLNEVESYINRLCEEM